MQGRSWNLPHRGLTLERPRVPFRQHEHWDEVYRCRFCYESPAVSVS